MKALLIIQTREEIFGCDRFPITFNTFMDMVRWLKRKDNHNFIEKILDVKE